MSKIELNKPVPNFIFSATNGLTGELKNYQGKTVVLYFYPKDNTPGCTIESKAFRDLFETFNDKNTVIFGISRDSLSSHERFKAKYSLPFELISDSDEKICQLFDVLRDKSLFGKKYRGLERSTFVIDKEGILRDIWRKVKIKGHAKSVIESITY